MSLILTGNTSNITIDSTNGITFPNSTLQASAGQLLQVVNATYSTQTSSTSSTYADTGLTASITPKFSTSKILVLVNMSDCGKDTNNTWLGLKLLRGSTTISTFTAQGAWTSSTASNDAGSCTISYLDSPSTTSSTTYKVQFASLQNNANVYVCIGNSMATITLMEIAS